jgi:hypothetical protein
MKLKLNKTPMAALVCICLLSFTSPTHAGIGIPNWLKKLFGVAKEVGEGLAEAPPTATPAPPAGANRIPASSHERTAATAQSEIASAQAEIKAAQAKIAELQPKLVAARATHLKATQALLEKLKTGANTDKEKEAETRANDAQTSLESALAFAQNDLQKAKDKKTAAEAKKGGNNK